MGSLAPVARNALVGAGLGSRVGLPVLVVLLLKKSKKAPTFREEMNREKHIYINDVKYIEEQKGK